jgi:hypothetical protein
MNTLLLMLLSCLWAILMIDYLEPFIYIKNKLGLGYKRKLYSDIKIINLLIYTIWKVLNCPMCLSYHLFWISYLIYYQSPFGIILGVVCYFLTFIIKEKILTIKL